MKNETGGCAFIFGCLLLLWLLSEAIIYIGVPLSVAAIGVAAFKLWKHGDEADYEHRIRFRAVLGGGMILFMVSLAVLEAHSDTMKKESAARQANITSSAKSTAEYACLEILKDNVGQSWDSEFGSIPSLRFNEDYWRANSGEVRYATTLTDDFRFVVNADVNVGFMRSKHHSVVCNGQLKQNGDLFSVDSIRG